MRGLLTQGPVRPVPVVMGDVPGQDAFEAPTTEDQRSVEALTADGADEAFGEGVGPWCPDRCANDADTFCLVDLAEARVELGVPVT